MSPGRKKETRQDDVININLPPKVKWAFELLARKNLCSVSEMLERVAQDNQEVQELASIWRANKLARLQKLRELYPSLIMYEELLYLAEIKEKEKNGS
jgi:hypothetical protein